MSLTREEIFDIWAPPGNPWFSWAIPVLFAQLPGEPTAGSATALVIPDTWDWAGDLATDCAVVVNLPGELAVTVGLSLVSQGFRPVPMFNACHGPHAVVDQGPIMDALVRGADWLSSQSIADDAPPAFLIDSGRMNGDRPIVPGMFDNRWKVFPQDFPSAELLASRGIGRCLVVQPDESIDADLCHVLRRWQDAGLAILRKVWESSRPPEEVEVPRPASYQSVWYRAFSLLKLKQNIRGGFGHIVPEPRKG